MLACRVGRHANAALKTQQRRDVDDAAAAGPQHGPPEALREHPHSIHIHRRDLTPIAIAELLGHFAADNAGVVDKDVDLAELFGHVLKEPLCGIRFGQVGNEGTKLATGCFDTRPRDLARLLVDRDRHVCAGMGQRNCNGLPDARSTAGYECLAALERKSGIRHGVLESAGQSMPTTFCAQPC
ncbi:hypothetical protein X942_5528 [Burkholderia pseudomallei MSHR5596]|nr:hypothetical protein X942_5528 [Burkholderia pseudomallei MSHR5596]